ncbi:MAG: ABC transporter permease [Tumebacillaceae bacterium]
MLNYTIRRLLQAIPLLFGISIISFGVMHLAPGGPGTVMINPKMKIEDQKRMIHALGLDQPVYVQYWKWLMNMLHGDFGTSYIYHSPVLGMIMDRLPHTLLLMGVSLVFGFLLAIPAGMLSATKQYTPIDYTVTGISFVGVATPTFWLGLMLIMLFSVKLHLLPAGGVQTMNAPFSLWDRIEHLILPAITLGAAEVAGWSRYTRSSMLEVLGQDYMRTARAKGLLENRVIMKHGFRNGMIPIVTIMGLTIPAFFGGAVITEDIFGWPGMGRLFIDAVFQRDYPTIMAITMLSAVLVVIGNMIADLLYAYLDPRISYE